MQFFFEIGDIFSKFGDKFKQFFRFMAAAAPTFKDIRQQIAARTTAPIYVVHGPEGYYVDELVKAFEAMVPEPERDFNLYVLYATQTDPEMVQEACMRYPMMAERQVVILKEAQAVKADYMEKLAAYAEHPNPQTVFVVAGRGEKVTGAKFLKAVRASGGVVFETPKLFENKVGPVIETLVRNEGMTIDQKALAMLIDHVGTDLSRIVNEVAKLKTALPAGGAITPQAVEKLIGVSKDFNNWELVDALAVRDVAKVYRIADYFRANPKQNPSIVTCVAIFGFFSKLLLAIYAPEKTESGIAGAIGARPYSGELKRIIVGMKNYSAWQVINAISACRRFDVRAKGIGSRADEYSLLRELLFTTLN